MKKKEYNPLLEYVMFKIEIEKIKEFEKELYKIIPRMKYWPKKDKYNLGKLINRFFILNK